MKRCPKCGTTKPLSDFYRDQVRARGVSSTCKKCVLARKKGKRDRQRSPDRLRKQRRRHALLPEQQAQMRVDQQGCCYLCERQLPDNSQQVHVDHDHSHCPPGTSCAICRRGLACSSCNTAIGLLNDDPDRIRRVADNLEHAQAGTRERIATAPRQDELFAANRSGRPVAAI